jgi:hypothetical protein
MVLQDGTGEYRHKPFPWVSKKPPSCQAPAAEKSSDAFLPHLTSLHTYTYIHAASLHRRSYIDHRHIHPSIHTYILKPLHPYTLAIPYLTLPYLTLHTAPSLPPARRLLLNRIPPVVLTSPAEPTSPTFPGRYPVCYYTTADYYYLLLTPAAILVPAGSRPLVLTILLFACSTREKGMKSSWA